MFKIFFHHLISNISCTPNTITNCPKMSTLIFFSQIREFFLNPSRRSPFQTLNNITNVLRRSILNMNVNIIFTDNSSKNTNVFRVTNLFYQISTPYLNISFKNMITIFCNPNYVRSEPRYSMSHPPLLFHFIKIQKWVATESLALKMHSFN